MAAYVGHCLHDFVKDHEPQSAGSARIRSMLSRKDRNVNPISFHFWMNLPFSASTHPSPVRGPSRKPRQHTPHPSNQVDPDSATIPSNPVSASTRREPRSLNREPRSTIRGSRSVDHGPMCVDLGPRTMVQGSGKVAGKVLIVDL